MHGWQSFPLVVIFGGGAAVPQGRASETSIALGQNAKPQCNVAFLLQRYTLDRVTDLTIPGVREEGWCEDCGLYIDTVKKQWRKPGNTRARNEQQ